MTDGCELDTTLSGNLRDRVLDVLDLISCIDSQRQYQEQAPVNVSNELFNQWEDWYYPTMDEFMAAFSPEELSCLAAFHQVFEEVCESTPQRMPPLAEFVTTSEWATLSRAAWRARVALVRASPGVDAALQEPKV